MWNIDLSKKKKCGILREREREREREKSKEKGLTSTKTVLTSLPEKAVMFAVIILSFKDSKTSQSFTIVSVLLLHVRLTTTVFSPM